MFTKLVSPRDCSSNSIISGATWRSRLQLMESERFVYLEKFSLLSLSCKMFKCVSALLRVRASLKITSQRQSHLFLKMKDCSLELLCYYLWNVYFGLKPSTAETKNKNTLICLSVPDFFSWWQFKKCCLWQSDIFLIHSFTKPH